MLVVDDKYINCLVAGSFCKQFGATVITAHSGTEAVRLCASGCFDVVLMDVRMPGRGGLEAARLIRMEAGAAMMPIIAVAGDGELDGETLNTCGITSVLVKPIMMHALFDAMSAALAKTGELPGISAAA